MSKGFFLCFAILYGAMLWYCIFTGKDGGEAFPMFVLFVGIFSIMKLIEERTA